jgi:hypothetical protein
MSEPILMFLIAVAFISGMIGLPVRLWIAGLLLSSESVDSAIPFRRYCYRYFVFSLHFLISFLTTPVLLGGVMEYVALALAPHQVLRGISYFLFCLPLAGILYYLDYKFMVFCDPAKVRARKN